MLQKSLPRLLLVEDDPDTAALICETLRDHFGADCVDHRASVAKALTVDERQIDLVLSDMNLPDGTGLDVLTKLLQRRPDLPVVLVTGEGILDNALQAIRQGAYDYIVKTGDYLFAIPIVVEKNLATWRTKRENRQLQEQLTRTLDEVRVKNQQLESVVAQLETMATTDPLTGLANRRAFTQALERCFAEKQRYNQDLACLMIDLDNFKQINDTLGHQAGDKLLQRTARVLEANCRRSDVAGRYGGDEFVILLPMTDESTARHVGTRILNEFSNVAGSVAQLHPQAPRISMSVGLACFSHGRPNTPEQLINHADHALYRAKQAGKARLAIFDPAVGQRTESATR